MSFLSSIIVPPLILLLSIPLAILATITSTFAFSTLFLRALIIYVELAAALIQNHFSPPATDGDSTYRSDPVRSPAPPIAASFQTSGRPIRRQSSVSLSGIRRKSRRSSAASGSSNGGSVTPRAAADLNNDGNGNGYGHGSNGLGIYSGAAVTRDFEGVGGWRLPDEAEDSLWANMNSRLELPAAEMTGVNNGSVSSTAIANQNGANSFTIASPPSNTNGFATVSGKERNHHRSRTSESNGRKVVPGMTPSSRSNGSGKSTTPTSIGTPVSNRGPGFEGDYFAVPRPGSGSKSTTALDKSANIGRTLLKHKASNSSGSGSTSSAASSAHNLSLTMANH